ncbi:putative coiled-coil protein SlyX [Bradyrhizobium sp. S3.2.6]
MPEADDPKADTQKTDTQKADSQKADSQKPGIQMPDTQKPDEMRADGGLARAFDQIKSAEDDLARLDRLVSAMERGSEGPRASQASAAAAAAEDKAPDSKLRDQGLKGDRPMLRALVGLVLAIGILGAAFASQYRDEAKSISKSISKSIMARWAPPATNEPPQASAVASPAQPPALQLSAVDQPGPLPPPPVGKETEGAPKPDVSRPDAPSTGTTAPDQPSSDLAQSLKTITNELASINGKLEQLKSRNEQTLREQADTIQQLKAVQEKDAADNARLAAQVQALQTQLTASSASASAKPAVRSVLNNDTAAPARPHVQAAAPRRPRPPRGPWMPPPYMVDPYGDPDW